MIGNSPKSDINPALEAGLGAVLVPHARTWVLEHQELRAPAGSRFLRVERFADCKEPLLGEHYSLLPGFARGS